LIYEENFCPYQLKSITFGTYFEIVPITRNRIVERMLKLTRYYLHHGTKADSRNENKKVKKVKEVC